MLYLLHQGNHPDLAYRGGQEPIVHLELNLQDVIVWARSKDLRWAMTLSNAGAYGFEDRCSLESLNEIDWNAVHATNWRDPDVKHRKQAEFLVERRCSWRLVQRVGVLSDSVGQKVLQAIQDSSHKPDVVIRRDWYY
jgi:hypothetical protein